MVKSTHVVDTFSRELSQVSFRDLQVLSLILSLGSVSAAAEALRVSQPTASYSLDKMRRIFRDELFVKRGRKLHPTDLCQKVSEITRGAQLKLTHACVPTETDPTQISGTVRVMSRGAAWRIFGKIDAEFLRQAPLGRLQHVVDRTVNLDRHLGHSGDFYIGAPQVEMPGISAHRITGLPFAMVFDPTKVTPPTTVEEFMECRTAVPWVFEGQGIKQLGAVDHALVAVGQPPREIAYASLNIPAIAGVLRNTDLIMTAPIHSLPENFAGLCHAPLPFEVETYEIGVRWRPEAVENPLVAFALDIAIAALDEEYSLTNPSFVTTDYQDWLEAAT